MDIFALIVRTYVPTQPILEGQYKLPNVVGYTLFAKGGQIVFVYNFLGIPPEQRTLFVDDKAVRNGPVRTQTGHYALAGEGLCIGYDSGDAVSRDYKPKFPFSGGRVIKVVFDVADDAYLDVERKFAAAMARD